MALTTVDDVAAMLRWGDAEKTKYQGQLDLYVNAASQVVEDEAGPFEAATVTLMADGGPSIVLPSRVASVVTVEVKSGDGFGWVDGYYVPTPSWDSLGGWTADLGAGIVYGPFTTGSQNIRVTYKVGSDPVPDAAKLAATMVAADMWAIASQRAPGYDDGQVDPSYLIPRAVRRLLEPFTTMPGFA